MEIQGILKNLREKNNLTQEQLAERVQVTRQAVSRWVTTFTAPASVNAWYNGGRFSPRDTSVVNHIT